MAVADLIVSVAGSLRTSTRDVLRMTHPRGTIGRLLLTRVVDLMSTLPQAPIIAAEATLEDAIGVLHTTSRGVVCGIDGRGLLRGILTDGDVRRIVRTNLVIGECTFKDVATNHPVTVNEDATLHEALRLMEERQSKISVLPVVDANGTLKGVVHLHDIVSYQFTHSA